MKRPCLIFDIDNTLHDWVAYFVPAHTALLESLSLNTGFEVSQLVDSMRSVYRDVESLEYGFVIQNTPILKNLFGTQEAFKKNEQIVQSAKSAFMQMRRKHFKLFPGVMDGLEKLRSHSAKPLIVALTDAPLFQSSQRLRKSGLDTKIDMLFALPDILPEKGLIPNSVLSNQEKGKFEVACATQALPNGMEKPDTDFKMIASSLMAAFPDTLFDLENCLVIGDNIKKDGGFAKKQNFEFIHADYGICRDPVALTKLTAWAPAKTASKNVAKKAHFELKYSAQSFAELVRIIEDLIRYTGSQK